MLVAAAAAMITIHLTELAQAVQAAAVMAGLVLSELLELQIQAAAAGVAVKRPVEADKMAAQAAQVLLFLDYIRKVNDE